MTKTGMTAKDYIVLMEDDSLQVPQADDTILANTSKFSPGSKEAFPTIDISATKEEPYEDNKKPSDAPDQPTVLPVRIGKKTGMGTELLRKNNKPITNNFRVKTMEMESDDMTIEMTADFLENLLQGVAEVSLDETNINDIVDAITVCADEDGVLDSDSISTVMANLRGDVDECDCDKGDDNKGDGKKSKKGNTQLMGADETDELGMDDEVSESRRGDYTRQRLDEMWMGTIPTAGVARPASSYEGMTEDEIEMAELRRLAGILE